MTSEQLKDEVVRKVLTACYMWANADEIENIDTALRLALYQVTLSKEETALSTDVRMSNEGYLKQFLSIKLVKGLSPKTIKLYTSTVQKFFQYVDRYLPEVTANDVRYYLAIRKTRDNVSSVTLNNELLNLRSFFSTLHNEEAIPRNPTAKIDRIKQEKKTKEPFTEMEVELIRRAAMTPRTALENPKRNLAIVDFLYSTGCRVSELVGVKKKDMNGERVKVLGKGNKERFVFLNPRAQISLADYLASRTDDFEWLFPGGDWAARDPHIVSDRPLDKGTVESMIRGLGRRAGVENCHPHRFRRTAATVALRRGMPIDQVSKMLGHESLATTQIYAITNDEEVQNSHRKYLT